MVYPMVYLPPGLLRFLLVLLIAGTQLRPCTAGKDPQPAKRTTRSAKVAPFHQTSSSSSSSTPRRGRVAAAAKGREAAIAPAATKGDAGENVDPGATFVVKAFANEGHENVVHPPRAVHIGVHNNGVTSYEDGDYEEMDTEEVSAHAVPRARADELRPDSLPAQLVVPTSMELKVRELSESDFLGIHDNEIDE